MKISERIKLEKLIEGCLRDCRTSQFAIYQQYFSYAMGIGLRYSQSREEAMEIVNDSFLKAFTRMDQFDLDLPFKPWFRQILVNTSIDYYRKFHKEQEVLDNKSLIFDSYLPAFNGAIKKMAYDDVINIINKLTPAYRMIFNLFVMEEYTHQEIASKLDISIGTSKSNLAKAKRQMRTLLNSNGNFNLLAEINETQRG